jgi:hypothetical protein
MKQYFTVCGIAVIVLAKIGTTTTTATITITTYPTSYVIEKSSKTPQLS